MRSSFIDPNVPNTPIPRPVETPENQKPSGFSRGMQNRKINNKRAKGQDKNNRRLTASKKNNNNNKKKKQIN